MLMNRLSERSLLLLLAARAVSGAFGGLSISMVMSIIGDVVPAMRRAAVVGLVMTAFSAAAAVGVPFGLQLAQHFHWLGWIAVAAGLVSVWLGSRVRVNEAVAPIPTQTGPDTPPLHASKPAPSATAFSLKSEPSIEN